MNNTNRFRFRAWSKHSREMLKSTSDSATPALWFDGTMHLEYDCVDVTDDLILMQSTGLLDANGVEIFEGDVVRDHVGQGMVKHDDKYSGFRVSYGDGRAKWFSDYLDSERKTIIVIGNIHENPELLKEQA
jgi:uncharacterized phage protein (TIGR01671 family)